MTLKEAQQEVTKWARAIDPMEQVEGSCSGAVDSVKEREENMVAEHKGRRNRKEPSWMRDYMSG